MELHWHYGQVKGAQVKDQTKGGTWSSILTRPVELLYGPLEDRCEVCKNLLLEVYVRVPNLPPKWNLKAFPWQCLLRSSPHSSIARNVSYCLFHGIHYPHQHSFDTLDSLPRPQLPVLLRAIATLIAHDFEHGGGLVSAGNCSNLPETPHMCLQMDF